MKSSQKVAGNYKFMPYHYCLKSQGAKVVFWLLSLDVHGMRIQLFNLVFPLTLPEVLVFFCICPFLKNSLIFAPLRILGHLGPVEMFNTLWPFLMKLEISQGVKKLLRWVDESSFDFFYYIHYCFFILLLVRRKKCDI